MSTGRRPLWRDGRFATFWSAVTVSALGDRVTELALPLIAVTMLHASAPVVGLLTAAVWAPNLLALVIGSWVDHRGRKKRVLVVADLIQAVAVLSLPVAQAVGGIGLAQLFVVALVAGGGSVLYDTAYPTFFVSLVRRDQYLEANALISGSRSGSFIVGPALAGGLVQLLTAPVAMLVDGLSFLVSALLVGRVRTDEAAREPDRSAGGLLRRSREGMTLLLRHPYLRASLACCTTLNFFGFVVAALVVLFASRSLGLEAGAIGLAFGLGATGGLLGAVLATRIQRRFGVGRVIALGAVLYSAPMALIPLAGGPVGVRIAVLAVAELVGSFGIMLFDVNLNSLQAAVTPDDLRSRVSGAFSTVNYGIRPLGAIVGGVAGALVGIGPTMVAAAVGGSLSFLWLLRSPIIGVRTIDELETVRPVSR